MFDDISTNALSTLGNTSTDVIVVVVAVVVFVVWGFMKGREVLLGTLFALYPAMLVTAYFPYQIMGGMAIATMRLLVFLVAVVAVFFVIRRQLSSSFFVSGINRWIEVIVLAFCVVGVMGVALYHTVDIGTVYAFSPLFDTLFLSPYTHIAWLAGPLLCVPLVIRS